MRATKSFQGGNSDNSVAENELLLIKGVRSKLTGEASKRKGEGGRGGRGLPAEIVCVLITGLSVYVIS